jgi:hypothetical protein
LRRCDLSTQCAPRPHLVTPVTFPGRPVPSGPFHALPPDGGGFGGLRNMKADRSVKVFKVESAQPYGWIVSMEDSLAKPHFFINRALATNYARLWARANAPSVLRVVDLHGRTIKEWSYTKVDALYA